MRETTTALLCLAATLAAPLFAAAAPQEDPTAAANRFRRDQPPPISLGASGGNALDFELDPPFISCASGTLGMLVEKNGVQYILSNNHVIAIQNDAEVGDPITQPGLIDSDPLCDFSDEDVVADLTGWKKIKFGGVRKNKVDAAIAEVRPGMVKTDGDILRIGQPGNDFVPPAVGMEVKKAGRTTGLTRGVVVATNASGVVSFGEDKDARFVKQLIIDGGGREIFAGGDSGSVFFEDVSECPRAVALGFAGTEQGDIAVASPMKRVLKAMKKVRPRGTVSLVGCEPVAASGFAAASSGTALWDERAPEVRAAQRIQKRREKEILALAEVAAIGIGRSAEPPGELVFKVFVTDDHPATARRVPERIDGIRTEIVPAGRFIAF